MLVPGFFFFLISHSNVINQKKKTGLVLHRSEESNEARKL